MAVPTGSCIGVYVVQFKSAHSLPFLRQGILLPLVHIPKFLILRPLTHDHYSDLAVGKLVWNVFISYRSYIYKCKSINVFRERLTR